MVHRSFNQLPYPGVFITHKKTVSPTNKSDLNELAAINNVHAKVKNLVDSDTSIIQLRRTQSKLPKIQARDIGKIRNAYDDYNDTSAVKIKNRYLRLNSRLKRERQRVYDSISAQKSLKQTVHLDEVIRRLPRR